MKANRTPRINQAEDAASVIVGAILLFALTFLVLIMVQTNFVPVWEEQSEATHSLTVRSQMNYLKSQMERQIEDGQSNPFSSPIDLERGNGGFGVGSQARIPGTIGLETAIASTFNITSPELNVATIADPKLVGLGENWQTITADHIENVADVASLRLRFGVDAKPYTTEWAYLIITDGDGDYAGEIGVNLLQMSTNPDGINKAEFYVSIKNSNGDIISGTYINTNNQNIPSGSEPDYAWINTLNPDYRFDRVLAAAKTPFTIDLSTTGGMPAQFSAAYYQQTAGGGTVLVGGGDEIITNYASEQSGSVLRYQSNSQHFVQQDLIMEFGAILVVQGDQASIATAPAFAVGTSSTTSAFSWTLPILKEGAVQSFSSRTGVVVTTATNHLTTTATGPEVTIEIATQYPSAWLTYWRNMFEVSGLTENDEYTLTSTADSASFTLSGPLTDATHDVSMAIQTSDIVVLL